ncbi:MAG: MG2 domain-containing protein, partial [Pyrinomonadaceae bacterium]
FFNIAFSNPLNLEKFQSAQVKITPDIPDAKISANYNSISIEGPKRSNTMYTVALDGDITDTFGQQLTGDQRSSFRVTTADSRLFTTSEGFVVLDPAGRRAFTVYSVNYRRLKVRLYQVTPDDWPRFRAYGAARRQNMKLKTLAPPGRLVSDKVIEVAAAPDELIETAIDLAPALTNKFGQVFVEVEPIEDRKGPVTVGADWENRVEAWVQSTEIGLDAFANKQQLAAWANSLTDGRPLAGVEISVRPDGLSGTTDASGLARLSFDSTRPANAEKQAALIVARRGDDVAMLPQNYYPSYYNDNNESHTWRHGDAREMLGWYVFDDRQLYRPGEEVRVKGWLRKINLTPTGSTEMFAAANKSINYVLRDSQNNEITQGSAPLNALAGFDLTLRLPAAMNLGHANLELKLDDETGVHAHGLEVQEFRRPEFEVTAVASAAPHFVGSFATATMTASYYAGGGLAATEVDWDVTATPTNYTPPNRGDYTFGKFYPWWRERDADDQARTQTFKGRTDAAGKHTLRMDFDGVNPPRPSSVLAQARVADVNRQTLAATATLLVHPADVYVGLRSARTFVQQGESFDIALIVTNLDGVALANRDVKIRLVRLDYLYEKGEWRQREVDAQERVVKSGADALDVRLPTRAGGAYRLTAQVRDERERLNESELSLWVAGGRVPPQREVAQERAELIPDRKAYAGGDTAEILVQSPFAPAEGVLTLRRSGLLRTERFTMKETSHTLRVPLEEAMTPNAHLQVDLVGAASRVDDAGNAQANLPKRPAFASGAITLEIPPAARRLQVTATPRDAVLEPGAETMVEVAVKDARGQNVSGTDTALVVVDESVLALTDYKLADPLSVFYATRSGDVSDYHLRDKVTLENPQEVERLALGDRAGGGGAGGGGGGAIKRKMQPE